MVELGGAGACRVVEGGGRCEGGGVCVFSFVFRGCNCCFLWQLEVVSILSFRFFAGPQIIAGRRRMRFPVCTHQKHVLMFCFSVRDTQAPA